MQPLVKILVLTAAGCCGQAEAAVHRSQQAAVHSQQILGFLSNPFHSMSALDPNVKPTNLASSKVDNVCAMLMIVFLCLALLGLIWVQRSRLRSSSKTELAATMGVGGYVVLTIVADILIRKFHQEGIDSYNFKPQVMTCLIEMGKVVVCGDILFVACIWCSMFKKRLAFNQVVGILLVFSACMTAHWQEGFVTAKMMWPIIVITSIAFVSSLGLVMNEFGFKASANLSIFVQCFALYIVTSGMNGIVVVATVPRAEIFGGIKWPQVLLIVLDVFLGLCVACVLKYANAMVKQLGSGWLAMLEPLVGHFFVGTPVTPVMVLATILAGAGSVVYRLEPASESSKKSSQ